MAELTRVPAPRSPLDGWRGRALSLVVVTILVAVAKPWGESPAPAAVDPSPSGPPTPAPAPIARTPTGRALDLAAFGPTPPAATWAIVTTARTIPLDFLDRDDDAPSAAPAVDGDPAGAIVSGPVVELGTSDEVDAIAIAHPADRSLATVRAWRFVDGGAPRRLELGRLMSPWTVDHVEVVGHRRSEMRDGQVLPWAPGLYRIDLLIEPADRVRSIMVHVAAGREPVAADGELDTRPVGTSFDPEVLGLLPDAANLWAVGGYLSGWRRETSRPGCRLAEIWRATDPADACWPLPLGRTDAIGVNLTDGRAVASIDLRGIDPLPGRGDVVAQRDVAGRPGLALVREPVGSLPDGIYRLDVRTTADEDLGWYVEVGPIGRAVAAYYEASTSR